MLKNVNLEDYEEISIFVVTDILYNLQVDANILETPIPMSS